MIINNRLVLTLMGCWLMCLGSQIALAQCQDTDLRSQTYFLSAETHQDNLSPIGNMAVGGAGQLGLFVVQQATGEGYQSITIDDTGHQAQGIEVLFSTSEMDEGVAGFIACSNQGFLVFAVYFNDQGQVAGVLADVLASSNSTNYANITLRSNERIGMKFNTGGAESVLSILEKQLGGDAISRRVAELVLTQNLTSVFDFFESQAPVYAFDSDNCVVADHVILHKEGQATCIGSINPAVDEIYRLEGDQSVDVLDTDKLIFQSLPNSIYVAVIKEGTKNRRVPFISLAESTLPKTLSSDPMNPTEITFIVGQNRLTGQVDDPRNTRDIIRFEVPEGAELTGIFLERWTAGIDQGYLFIDDGPTTVIASQETSDQFLGGLHISSTLYGPADNLLRFMSSGSAGGTGFDAPLSAGVYTFTIQQTGNVPSGYTMLFLIE